MYPLTQIYHWLQGFLTVVMVLGIVGWFLYGRLRRADDPGLLVFKWVLTVLILGWLAWQIEAFSNSTLDMSHVASALTGAIILMLIWRHSIGAWVAKPFSALYDGGDTEIEPQPYYSIAEAKRKKGLYRESIEQIRKQLTRFPTDYTGQMMLAEIQAQNLDDLPGAELTLNRLLAQSNHSPRNVAHILNTLADWHLKYTLDRDAAQQHLQRIIEMLPDTELALAAEQRIAHLASTEKMLSPHDRQLFEVKEGVKNLGLLIDRKAPGHDVARDDSDAVAAEYAKHLAHYPMDFEVREKLAMMYADHYRRLDLATDQLEQLIEAPAQPMKKVAHWLNVLADLQVRHSADLATVQATLERISGRFPNSPVAEMAQARLSHLKLEFKGKEKATLKKMGTYEQNIGLKSKRNY